MGRDELLEHVCQRSGLRSAREAAFVVEAVVEAVGAWLDAPLRRAVATRLPEDFAAALSRGEREPPLLEALYGQLAEREQGELGFAIEHAQAALEVVGEALRSELRERVERALPHELAALLSGRPTVVVPVASAQTQGETLADAHAGGVRSLSEAAPGTQRGLAGAKPGSTHPLSEAKPERAQRGSVARWDDTRDDDTLGGYRPKGEG